MPFPSAPQLLDFERAHPRHSGAKEERIARVLGLSSARYYVLLHRAAASVDGMRHDAVTARVVRDREHRAA